VRLGYWLFASAALLLASDMTAHADIITTFTLTHGSDTIQFSLSDSTPFTFQLGFPGTVQEFEYSVPLTVDGVVHTSIPGGDVAQEGFESLQAPGVGAEFYVAYESGVVNGIPQYVDIFDQDIQIYTDIGGKAVFTPGTYIFPQVVTVDSAYGVNGDQEYYSSDDTLVITQTDTSSSSVPEPSTFVLLGTGLAGALGTVRRRFVC
jgi:hypothetical protein